MGPDRQGSGHGLHSFSHQAPRRLLPLGHEDHGPQGDPAPLGRDLLAELRKSCDKYGIRLALYFSLGEFADNKDYHPGGYTPEMHKAQLKELCTRYGPIEFFWMDCAQGNGGLDCREITAWVKRFQPGCFVCFNGGGAGDLCAGEMGRPGPVKDFLVGEFTYPILPAHSGGACWFYSLPQHDGLCRSAKSLYRDYVGAVKYGNIFSLDVGPDYAGRLRKIDVETLHEVAQMIEHAVPPEPTPLSEGKAAKASSTWGPGYEADKAFDGGDDSRWALSPRAERLARGRSRGASHRRTGGDQRVGLPANPKVCRRIQGRRSVEAPGYRLSDRRREGVCFRAGHGPAVPPQYSPSQRGADDRRVPALPAGREGIEIARPRRAVTLAVDIEVVVTQNGNVYCLDRIWAEANWEFLGEEAFAARRDAGQAYAD